MPESGGLGNCGLAKGAEAEKGSSNETKNWNHCTLVHLLTQIAVDNILSMLLCCQLLALKPTNKILSHLALAEVNVQVTL